MIDKNRPLLATESSLAKHSGPSVATGNPRRKSTGAFSITLATLLGLAVVGAGRMRATTPMAPDRTVNPKATVSESAATTSPPDTPVRLARPRFDRSPETTAAALIQECLEQLFSGPPVQADVLLNLEMETGVASLLTKGEFYNLGRGTGLAKTGLQLPSHSEMAWVVSREKTCIQTIPSDIDRPRQVTQQPEWFASSPAESSQACYGSPISLLQWAKRHFHFDKVDREDKQVILEGQLRPQIAKGWGDGTIMSDPELKAPTASSQWLAAHVVFPLPHRIRLTFSDQPQTARTLLEFSLYRYGSDSETPVLLLQSQWQNWQLAAGLTPQDFPRETIMHQTADRKSPIIR